MKNDSVLLQRAARKKLKLDPFEKTAIVATGKSSTPVGVGRDEDEGEIYRADLIDRLVNPQK